MACQLKLIGNSLHATHVGVVVEQQLPQRRAEQSTSCKDASISIPLARVCRVCVSVCANPPAFEVSFLRVA